MRMTVSRLASSIGKWSNRGLWKSAWLCFSGFLLVFVIYTLSKGQLSDWGKEILIHIQNAFLVACILTITIEYNARRRTEQNIKQNLFEDLLEHVMPREVVDEVNSFLRASVIRKECKYILTFKKPYAGMPLDYFVIQRDLSFEIENLTTNEVIFPVRSSYSAHPDRISSGWDRNFHMSLEVDGEPVEHLESYLSDKDGLHLLEFPLPLGPQAKATVDLSGEEPSRIDSGSNSYTQGTTVIGIEVDIYNLYPEAIGDIQVFMHHPAAHRDTKHKGSSRHSRHSLKRAFLPGQGFEIRWRAHQKKSATRSRPEHEEPVSS